MTAVGLSFLCVFVSAGKLSSVGIDDMGVSLPLTHTDSVERDLEEIEVLGASGQGWKKGVSSVWLNTSDLSVTARVLGEKDIIGAIKTLTGVMSSGDYGSGIIVDGTEASQTMFMIDDAPVFFPYRFGGIFSSFNSAFFQIAEFERNRHAAAMPSRLGGKVSLRPYYNCDGLKGEVNVGLIASSATLRFGNGSRWNVGASGRVSYLNKLYGKLLKSKEQTIGYDFSDINIGGTLALGEYDRLVAGYFLSTDHLSANGQKYEMDTRIRWKNEVASLGWRHRACSEKGADVGVTAYYSGFNSRMNLVMPGLSVAAPAEIQDFGLTGNANHQLNDKFDSKVSYGLELNRYKTVPQWCDVAGFDSSVGNSAVRQVFGSYRSFADYSCEVITDLEISAGLSLGYYHVSGYGRVMCDPRLNLTWRSVAGDFMFHFGTYHQYLHQTGFSEIGLASDFWSGATETAPVTKSYSFALGWNKKITNVATIEAEAYYKLLRNTPEFDGVVLDLVENGFDALGSIRPANGYSYGLNIRLSRDFRNVSGSISYGFGDGFRHFADDKYWRSRTSLGNILKMSVTYKPDRHWVFGATFNYASGRPYTPVKTVYLVAESAMLEYGEHNSRRLPANQRLDVSASYVFRSGGKFPLKHILNFSLLNAYGHKNVEMQYYIVNPESGRIRLKQVYSLYRFLPSISYTIEL